MADLLEGLWLPGDEAWGLGSFHASVEGVDMSSSAEGLRMMARVEPEVKLTAGVAPAHIMEVVNGECKLYIIHQGERDEAHDPVRRLGLSAVASIVQHVVRGPPDCRRVLNRKRGHVCDIYGIVHVLS